MHWYTIQETLTHTDHPPQPETPAVVLLTSEELDHHPTLPGLETVLLHTPSAQDAKVCKADVRWDCLSGTLVLPRQEKDEGRTTYGYLIAQNRVVLVDDGDTVPGLLRHIAREKRPLMGSVGRFVYAFFNQLVARDLHHLEEIEDRAQALEDQVLNNQLKEFTAPMTSLRKESTAWFRYYSQLDDVACELRKNDNGCCSRCSRIESSACGRSPSCCGSIAPRSRICSKRRSASAKTTSCRSSPSSPPSSSPSPCWWAGTG